MKNCSNGVRCNCLARSMEVAQREKWTYAENKPEGSLPRRQGTNEPPDKYDCNNGQ